MYDETTNIIDLKVMKITGFYQLINPHTKKYFGLNLFKVGAGIEIVCGIISMGILTFSSLYHLQATNELMSHFMMITALIFTILKMIRVWMNSDSVWKCLEMASVDFLSYKDHDRDHLRKERKKSIKISRMFFTFWIFAALSWIYSPFTLKEVYLDANIKGDVQHFRYNSLNYVFPITDEFFNDNFIIFYMIETIQIAFWCHVTVAYDPFVISVCIAIAAQLKTIADSYSELCYDLEKLKGNAKVTKEEDVEAMIKLRLLIQDQQSTFGKIKEMYRIIRPVTFVHIAAQSTLITLQTYMIFINHYNGLAFTSAPIQKLLSTVIPNVVHLYVTCNTFGNINDQKDSMNDALYGSNWTGMSHEYKKAILYAMRMNDAEMLKLKVSMTKIINLEMFSSVMQTTYSIISLLAKSYGSTRQG